MEFSLLYISQMSSAACSSEKQRGKKRKSLATRVRLSLSVKCKHSGVGKARCDNARQGKHTSRWITVLHRHAQDGTTWGGEGGAGRVPHGNANNWIFVLTYQPSLFLFLVKDAKFPVARLLCPINDVLWNCYIGIALHGRTLGCCLVIWTPSQKSIKDCPYHNWTPTSLVLSMFALRPNLNP